MGYNIKNICQLIDKHQDTHSLGYCYRKSRCSDSFLMFFSYYPINNVPPPCSDSQLSYAQIRSKTVHKAWNLLGVFIGVVFAMSVMTPLNWLHFDSAYLEMRICPSRRNQPPLTDNCFVVDEDTSGGRHELIPCGVLTF